MGKLANAAAHLQLGRVRHALGRLEEARAEYKYASEIQNAELPAGHPDLAVAQLELAQLDADVGNFKEALSKIEAATLLFANSVSEPEKYSVNENQYSASQLPLILGRAFSLRSDILQHYADHRKDALRLAEKGFKLQASVLGETAPQVAYAAKVFGNAQLLMGDARSALDNYQHALQANLGTLGSHHLVTASSYSYVARALQKMQQDASAEGYHEQAVKIIRSAQRKKNHLGNPSAEVIPFHNFGAFLWEHGRVQEAIVVLRYAAQFLKAQGVPETSSRRKTVENTLSGMLSRVISKNTPVLREPKNAATSSQQDSNVVPVDEYEVGEDEVLDAQSLEEIDRVIKLGRITNKAPVGSVDRQVDLASEDHVLHV